MKGRTVALVVAIVGMVGIALWLRATKAPVVATVPTLDASSLSLPEASSSAVVEVADTAPPVAALVEAGPSTDCVQLAAHNAALIKAAVRADAGGCLVIAPDINCITMTNRVSWGYRLVATVAYQNPQDSGLWIAGSCETDDEVELVRSDEAGARAMPDAGEVLEYTWMVKQKRRSVQALADYDNDGEIEILLSRAEHEHEGPYEHEAHVMTYQAGALVPYSPAAGVPIDRIEDVDHDGRPDLLSRGPYDGVMRTDGLGNQERVGPVMFVAHSLADGTFSMTDSVAKAFARGKCPARPPLTLTTDPYGEWQDDVAAPIVCARLWGATDKEVTLMWERSCLKADADPQPCQGWPKDLGAVRPPFILP